MRDRGGRDPTAFHGLMLLAIVGSLAMGCGGEESSKSGAEEGGSDGSQRARMASARFPPAWLTETA